MALPGTTRARVSGASESRARREGRTTGIQMKRNIGEPEGHKSFVLSAGSAAKLVIHSHLPSFARESSHAALGPRTDGVRCTHAYDRQERRCVRRNVLKTRQRGRNPQQAQPPMSLVRRARRNRGEEG